MHTENKEQLPKGSPETERICSAAMSSSRQAWSLVLETITPLSVHPCTSRRRRPDGASSISSKHLAILFWLFVLGHLALHRRCTRRDERFPRTMFLLSLGVTLRVYFLRHRCVCWRSRRGRIRRHLPPDIICFVQIQVNLLLAKHDSARLAHDTSRSSCAMARSSRFALSVFSLAVLALVLCATPIDAQRGQVRMP